LAIKNPINKEMQDDIRAKHKDDLNNLEKIREEISQNTNEKTIKEYKNLAAFDFISGKTRETSDEKEQKILEDVKTKFKDIEEKSYKGEDVDKIYKGIGAEGIFLEGTGLVISEVYPGSPAEKMNLKNQDVITHFHNQEGTEVPITNTNIKEAISAIRQGNGFKTNDKEIKNITPEFINTKYKATHANVLTIKSDSDFKKELENIKPQENYKAQKIDKIKSKIGSKSR
jgi:C-terminal processing protease CtpA/Prc